MKYLNITETHGDQRHIGTVGFTNNQLPTDKDRWVCD